MESNVEELLEIIKLHNDNYRKGHPIVPDSVYDHEIEILRQLDPDNPWLKAPEPVKVGEARKVSLPIPMKSLYKVKDIVDLMDWCNNAGLSKSDMVVVMPKYDGLSLLCNEATGQAYSRGGAENEGQDCTSHLKKNGSQLCPRFKYTFGEFVFSVENWNANFVGKISPDTGRPYRSPRNTAAGLLNRDVPIDELAFVSFYRYGLDEESIENGGYQAYHSLLHDLCVSYGQPPLYKVVKVAELNDELLQELYKDWCKQYYIDGLVIYVDNLEAWKNLGRQDTTGNPRYAIAYKHPDFTDTFETTVEGIEWGATKSGLLKPVVQIEAVDTGDCSMTSPTGYNASFIRRMQIAKGAKVLVTRSGGVIPKILQTLSPATEEERSNLWRSLEKCPYCGQPTQWSESNIELTCANLLCPGTRQAKIIFFYMTCGAENIGPELVGKLYRHGLSTVEAILHATYEDLIDVDGVGEHNANSLLKNNEKILYETDLPTLMQASNCFPGIGKIKAQQILDNFGPEITNGLYDNVNICELTKVPDSRTLKDMSRTAQIFWNGIHAFQNFIAHSHIKAYKPEVIAARTDGRLKDICVCFSGIRDKELEVAIAREGGSVVTSMNKATTHLVVKDVNAGSSKIIKAKRDKKPILTIDDFKAQFGL